MKSLDLKERIERLLDYLNLNQKEFARKTGISENTISHAKKGKHTPNINFFNSIYRYLPTLNPQWLYMGLGDMFADTKQNIHATSRKLFRSMTLSRNLKESECNDELATAEKEIKYLKAQIEDKKQIITLLKNSSAT